MAYILIADDDYESRELLRFTLTSLGHEVAAVDDGVKALASARAHTPGMIISDILMPEMDGFDLCRAIKLDDKLKAIPFIFYTATYVAAEDEQLAMDLGGSGFIRKAVDAARFVDVLKQCISQHLSGSVQARQLDDASLPVLDRQHEQAVTSKLALKMQELHLEQKEHRESLELLGAVFEASMSAIIGMNAEGRIIIWNAAAMHMFGYAADEAMALRLHDLLAPEQQEGLQQALQHFFDTGEEPVAGRLIELTGMRKDGTTFPISLTAARFRRNHGWYAVTTMNDISEHKQLEQQFIQAQKMEALGVLVGGIAHDFNNMLAGITGNLYLARKKMQGHPDAVQNLTNVEELSFRAADMIQQLLTFARKDRVSMNTLPLTPFVKETLKFLRSSVPENIKIEQHIAANQMQVKGDATQLHQILMNLVNNACDALESVVDPCITVNLELFQPDEALLARHEYFRSGSYAHLSVEDNGCGIPAQQIEHLFEPFFTTKKVGKGTGLGLAMVFGAVKTHHGYIDVKSNEGEGCSFHIYLPLLETQGDVCALEQSTGVAEGHGETILIADDETHILETNKEVLESLGYQVLAVRDGQQAVEIFKARAEEIDLCILDIVMPVMGGDKAAQLIRQINPKAKIFFASGYDKNTQSEMEHETVLTKPFSIGEMSRMIRHTLDG